jgi:adenosine deaminase
MCRPGRLSAQSQQRHCPDAEPNHSSTAVTDDSIPTAGRRTASFTPKSASHLWSILREGLTAPQVVRKRRCKQPSQARAHYGIEARLILCTLRHYTAGPEPRHRPTGGRLPRHPGRSAWISPRTRPPTRSIPTAAAFELVRIRRGFRLRHMPEKPKAPKAYARELSKAGSPTALATACSSIEDPELMVYLREQGVHLEVCPTSNIQTNVFPTLSEHAVDALYQAGISLSINTDGRALSHTTLSQEYGLLAQTFSWKLAHFQRCNLAAVEHAFAPTALKVKLNEQIRAAYSQPTS